MSYVLFMSDMHLDPSRPEVSQLFIDYLQQHAPTADALYLLGDLFEVWLGDPVSLSDYPEVIATLRQLTNHGTAVYVMRGNRDFMFGNKFASATGATLLPDPTVIDIYGEVTLLSHGDQLCTDDVAYQRYRKIVNNRLVQWLALHCIPDRKKRQIASNMRAASKKAQAEKQADIMDVNDAEVRRWFERHQVTQMIHGHTHRPKQHQYQIDGETVTRWVLGDWYEQGSVLSINANGEKTLQSLPLSTLQSQQTTPL